MKYEGIFPKKVPQKSPSMRREWIEIIIKILWSKQPESPSMRREWIEIVRVSISTRSFLRSPSMRREWIEI